MLEFLEKGKQIVDQFALLLLQCQRLPCLQNVSIQLACKQATFVVSILAYAR